MTDFAHLTRRAAMASVATAVFLLVLKGWASWTTGSAAMLGSLADTGLDLVASIATLIGVRIAAQPADDNHRFGHGKAEALAAMFQVVLISLSAAGIAIHAVQQWMGEARSEAASEGIIVSLIAIAATMALLAYQRHVLAKTRSVAIGADHLHYQSDLLLNLAVIAALLCDQYLGLSGADPLFALGIAAWLGWGAWSAARAAVEQLMDEEWPDERKAAFLDIIAHHPELKGVHDLRTRSSGMVDFVQFHAAVDGGMTVAEAHRVMDEIEARLEAEFPGVEVLIHPDPHGLINEAGESAENLLDSIRR